jgi:hypothetical protein
MLPYPASPLLLRFVAGALFFSLIYAGIIKYFERKLTFGQAYLISLITNLVLGALLAVYTFAKPRLSFSPELDLSVNLALLVLMGFTITRLAANYGIKKEGWFSLGAKVVLIFVIFVIAVAGLNLLIGADIFSGVRR